MIYLNLLIGFLKVGMFSFGGAYAAIPLIRDVVLAYGWMTDEELSYMIAVSESTPGPIMINLATYVGSHEAGIIGAVIATVAVALPAFIIIILLTRALTAFMNNRYVAATLGGLKPCITGIILATGLYMTATCIIQTKSMVRVDISAIIIMIILAACMLLSKPLFKKNMSPVVLIVIAAGLGIVSGYCCG